MPLTFCLTLSAVKLNDLRKSKLVSYCVQGVIVKVQTSPLIIHT